MSFHGWIWIFAVGVSTHPTSTLPGPHPSPARVGVVESSGIPEKTRKGKGMLKAAAAAAAASARKFVSKDSGTAGGSDAAALEVDRMHIDSSGRRRKRLTRSQEEYR